MALQLAEWGLAGPRSEASYLLFLCGAPPPGGLLHKDSGPPHPEAVFMEEVRQKSGIGVKSAPGAPFVRPPVAWKLRMARFRTAYPSGPQYCRMIKEDSYLRTCCRFEVAALKSGSQDAFRHGLPLRWQRALRPADGAGALIRMLRTGAEAVPHLTGSALVRAPACLLLGLGLARMSMLVVGGPDSDALHRKLPLRRYVLLEIA